MKPKYWIHYTKIPFKVVKTEIWHNDGLTYYSVASLSQINFSSLSKIGKVHEGFWKLKIVVGRSKSSLMNVMQLYFSNFVSWHLN